MKKITLILLIVFVLFVLSCGALMNTKHEADKIINNKDISAVKVEIDSGPLAKVDVGLKADVKGVDLSKKQEVKTGDIGGSLIMGIQDDTLLQLIGMLIGGCSVTGIGGLVVGGKFMKSKKEKLLRLAIKIYSNTTYKKEVFTPSEAVSQIMSLYGDLVENGK